MKKERYEIVAEGFVLNKKGDRLLFMQRTKPPMVGFWLPPGGHVSLSKGETILDGLLREVKDETNIVAEVIDLETTMPVTLDERTERIPTPHHIQIEDIDKKHDHIDLIFICRAVNEGPLRSEGKKGVSWLSYEDVVRLPMPENIRDLAERILSGLVPLLPLQ